MCIRDSGLAELPDVEARITAAGRAHGARLAGAPASRAPVSYTHLRAHETPEHLVCRRAWDRRRRPWSIRGSGLGERPDWVARMSAAARAHVSRLADTPAWRV